jgi:hypothetical protein
MGDGVLVYFWDWICPQYRSFELRLPPNRRLIRPTSSILYRCECKRRICCTGGGNMPCYFFIIGSRGQWSTEERSAVLENDAAAHVYAVGADSAIWLRRGNVGSWTDWESLGGTFFSSPAAVTRLADNVPTRDIVALGTDHALWRFELFDP